MGDDEQPPAPPPLYQGRRVPFGELHPDDFEKCVFACLICVQGYVGLRIDGRPAGSGDGGFDIQGVAVPSGRTACIQCKRQAAVLGLPLLAAEVAKVAATAALERSDVGVHRFVCTGGVTMELHRMLREHDHGEIKDAATQVLQDGKKPELKTLRDRLAAEGRSCRDVVHAYVDGLDVLHAWSMDEFDALLACEWERVTTVLERYFQIANVVREHPRAQFQRVEYQSWCAGHTAIVRPRLEHAELPTGLAASSAASAEETEPRPQRDLREVADLASLEMGEAALVVADGGTGKTTLFRLVRAEVAKRLGDSRLAVVISCGDYTSGGLDQIVHSALGVTSGSWRTIPDEVLLLIDGINEAPSDAVRKLFGELRPLLESGRIACVLSSRADSRHVRAVLPAPTSATLRLVPLTPGGVRAIAEATLADGADVEDFLNAHRELASRAGGPLMWTPFAVHEALRVWRQTQTLGSTLGELLRDVVRARAKRDLETALEGVELDAACVLDAASALAFQMLVLDQQVACDITRAGGAFARAKELCRDVLGVDGLNTARFSMLLRRHELLQQTTDGALRWTHQLIAGSLAARRLAKDWRVHVGTLEQTITDDAWVFAAPLVAEDELEEYLATLCDADLHLAARAASELLPEKRDIVLEALKRAVRADSPENVQAAGMYALARVGTDAALDVLRGIARSDPDAEHTASCALAFSGNRGFLLELCKKVDDLRRGPFSITGGEVAVWESASFPDRLFVARERLAKATPGEPVNESLSLVALEASTNDLPLLERHLRAAHDANAWWTTLGAIELVDHAFAEGLFEEALRETLLCAERASLMTGAYGLGLAVDVGEAFATMRELALSKPTGSDYLTLNRLIEKVLVVAPLPDDVVLAVEQELPDSTAELRGALWAVAQRIPSPALANHALEAFAQDQSVASAANYFYAHPELRVECAVTLEENCESYLRDREHWYTRGSWRVLTLLADVGMSDSVVFLLESMVHRLVEILDVSERGQTPDFLESEKHIARGFKVDSARIHLSHVAGYLVPGVVAAVDRLSPGVPLQLLRFDLANQTPGRELAQVLSHFPAEAIDDALCDLRDPWSQLSGLRMVCEFGLTRRRLELLRGLLVDSICHPLKSHQVKAALEKAWNPDALRMVVQAVSSIDDWPRDCEQTFWDFIRSVANRVTPEDRPVIDQGLEDAKTAFAQRMLRIWHQRTFSSRVGLSRLADVPRV